MLRSKRFQNFIFSKSFFQFLVYMCVCIYTYTPEYKYIYIHSYIYLNMMIFCLKNSSWSSSPSFVLQKYDWSLEPSYCYSITAIMSISVLRSCLKFTCFFHSLVIGNLGTFIFYFIEFPNIHDGGIQMTVSILIIYLPCQILVNIFCFILDYMMDIQ